MSARWIRSTLFLVVLLALAACAAPAPTQVPADTGTAPAAEKVTLRMTLLTGPVAEGVQAALPGFLAQHPNVAVNLEIQADEMGWQSTAPSTMFASSDRPDLTWWWCSRTTQYKDMIAAGLLEPLDDLYEREGWLDSYPKGTLDFYLEPDGHRYGINIDVVWTPYVYYNKEIFAQVGIDVPTTWDEFYANAEQLRAAGYEPLSMVYEMSMRSHLPDALMLRSWTEEEYQAFLLNWSAEAPEWALQYKWTDPNGVRIFQTIQDMADKGVFPTGFAGLTDYNQAKAIFTSGKAAMYQDGSWAGGSASLPQEADFEWGYFYYPPINEAAYGPVGGWIPNCYIVFKGDQNVQAAKDLVAYLVSPPAMEVYLKASGLTPGRIDLPADKLEEIMNETTKNMITDVKEMGAPALYESAVPPALLDTLKQSIDLMLNDAITVEEAAEMMQEATEKARTEG